MSRSLRTLLSRRSATAVAAATLAAAGLVAGAGTALAAPAPAAPAGTVCDDGPWSAAGGSVEGTPANFAPGAANATFVWHDGGGWHLRTTDDTPGPHHYVGTVAASPGAHLTGVTAVHLEPGDHLWVDGNQVLHYDLTTFEHVDGIDFHVTACDGDRYHEALTFDLHRSGVGDDPRAIELGHDGHHPTGDPFVAVRVV